MLPLLDQSNGQIKLVQSNETNCQSDQTRAEACMSCLAYVADPAPSDEVATVMAACWLHLGCILSSAACTPWSHASQERWTMSCYMDLHMTPWCRCMHSMPMIGMIAASFPAYPNRSILKWQTSISPQLQSKRIMLIELMLR